MNAVAPIQGLEDEATDMEELAKNFGQYQRVGLNFGMKLGTRVVNVMYRQSKENKKKLRKKTRNNEQVPESDISLHFPLNHIAAAGLTHDGDTVNRAFTADWSAAAAITAAFPTPIGEPCGDGEAPSAAFVHTRSCNIK
uniref:Uncharacterized protein n=1 Tax=Romanomermis culicivorax TaxID=13658 RepID=A0A915I705_ROMCU